MGGELVEVVRGHGRHLGGCLGMGCDRGEGEGRGGGELVEVVRGHGRHLGG